MLVGLMSSMLSFIQCPGMPLYIHHSYRSTSYIYLGVHMELTHTPSQCHIQTKLIFYEPLQVSLQLVMN